MGILTTQAPLPPASTDYVLRDWQAAGLRMVSWFRLYPITVQQADLSNIGRVSPHDWTEIQARIRTGFGIGPYSYRSASIGLIRDAFIAG